LKIPAYAGIAVIFFSLSLQCQTQAGLG
jgi:hypothetical protein